jgi:hypothetical protein
MTEDPGLFDATFFNYSAETASVRDPTKPSGAGIWNSLYLRADFKPRTDSRPAVSAPTGVRI